MPKALGIPSMSAMVMYMQLWRGDKCGCDAGQTTIEWLGISAVIVAFIGVFLAFTDVGESIANDVSALICQASGQSDCPLGDGESVADGDQGQDQDSPPLDPRAQAAQDRLDALDGPAALESEIQAAINAGDLAAAEALLDRLELIDELVADDERGEFVDDLFNASDDEFADLIADGTIYLENGKFNTAYFQLDDPPGGGVVVMDFFIESAIRPARSGR